MLFEDVLACERRFEDEAPYLAGRRRGSYSPFNSQRSGAQLLPNNLAGSW
jgi:hypothetical protein